MNAQIKEDGGICNKNNLTMINNNNKMNNNNSKLDKGIQTDTYNINKFLKDLVQKKVKEIQGINSEDVLKRLDYVEEENTTLKKREKILKRRLKELEENYKKLKSNNNNQNEVVRKKRKKTHSIDINGNFEFSNGIDKQCTKEGDRNIKDKTLDFINNMETVSNKVSGDFSISATGVAEIEKSSATSITRDTQTNVKDEQQRSINSIWNEQFETITSSSNSPTKQNYSVFNELLNIAQNAPQSNTSQKNNIEIEKQFCPALFQKGMRKKSEKDSSDLVTQRDDIPTQKVSPMRHHNHFMPQELPKETLLRPTIPNSIQKLRPPQFVIPNLSPRPEFRNPRPGVRNPGPEVQNPRPEVRHLRPMMPPTLDFAYPRPILFPGQLPPNSLVNSSQHLPNPELQHKEMLIRYPSPRFVQTSLHDQIMQPIHELNLQRHIMAHRQPPPSYIEAIASLPILIATILSDQQNIIIKWTCTPETAKLQCNVHSYVLYAYYTNDLTKNPSQDITLWKFVGATKGLPLPISCTLTQNFAKANYFFAVMPVNAKGISGKLSNVCPLKVIL